MIEVQQIDIADYELDGVPFDFDEYSSGYDFDQWGQNYEYYLIKDMAYWDALVCWDTRLEEIVACHSQVISLEEAEAIFKKHRDAGIIITV
jgi:hypothetical protein